MLQIFHLNYVELISSYNQLWTNCKCGNFCMISFECVCVFCPHFLLRMQKHKCKQYSAKFSFYTIYELLKTKKQIVDVTYLGVRHGICSIEHNASPVACMMSALAKIFSWNAYNEHRNKDIIHNQTGHFVHESDQVGYRLNYACR